MTHSNPSLWSGSDIRKTGPKPPVPSRKSLSMLLVDSRSSSTSNRRSCSQVNAVRSGHPSSPPPNLSPKTLTLQQVAANLQQPDTKDSFGSAAIERWSQRQGGGGGALEPCPEPAIGSWLPFSTGGQLSHRTGFLYRGTVSKSISVESRHGPPRRARLHLLSNEN